MSFLTPLYLAGAALIALPIILHLLRRDVAPPVPFTAVQPAEEDARSIDRASTGCATCCCWRRASRALLLLAGVVRAAVSRRRAADRPDDRRRRRSIVQHGGAGALRAGARAGARGDRRRRSGDRVASSRSTIAPTCLRRPAPPRTRAPRWPRSQPGFGATRYAAAFDKAAELLPDEAHGRLVVVTDLQRSGFDDRRRGAAGGHRAPGPRRGRRRRRTCR